jgi:DNA-binding transcriptional LysR family regulator
VSPTNQLLLDLSRLRIFVAVARTGSFTRAAEELDLRQPTVSQQIQVLERGLRTRLFERLGRGIQLTTAGTALLGYAERILELVDEAQAATREAAGLAHRTLRLGAGNTLATYILPDLLARLRWEQPDVVVQITVGNTNQLIDAVIDHRVELALVGSPIMDNRLAIHPFLRDELVVIVPPDRPWTGRTTIALEEMWSHTLLMREPGSALQASLREILRLHEVEPEHTITLGNLEAIKRSVEAGLGISIVPEIAVRREVQVGTLQALTITNQLDERSFNYIYRHDRVLSPPARIFAALVEKPFE